MNYEGDGCSIVEILSKHRDAPLPRTHIELAVFVEWCDKRNIPTKSYYRKADKSDENLNAPTS